MNPGFGGRASSKAYQEAANAARDGCGPGLEIEADGGINAETIPAVVAAGATIAIAGTCVFQHEKGIAAGIAELRRAAALATVDGES